MLWSQRLENAAAETDRVERHPSMDEEVRSPHRVGEPPIARDLHFLELTSILYRRSRMILTLVVVGTILAAIVGLLIAPKYTATAQIVVMPQQGAANGPAFAPADESPIDTEVAMLSSRDHLQRVLDSLPGDPEFGAAFGTGGDGTGSITTTLAGKAQVQPAVAQKPADPATTEAGSLNLEELWRRLKMWTGALKRKGRGMETNVEQMRRDLNIMQERRSRVISVSFTSKSPTQAAVVANQIVRLYVDSQIAQKRASVKLELAKVGERLAELKTQIEGARTTVQTFVDKPPGSDHVTGREAREPDAQLREVEHGAAAAGQQYFHLLRRQEEVSGQLEAVKADVSIVSLASPPHRPSSSNPILFILPAMIVLTICAGFLAVVLERLDRRLRSERDIKEALAIPCLGLVPQLPREGRTRPLQHVIDAPFAPYCEAIRSIAAGLQLVPPHRASKVILITSSMRGEGKTTLAGSLAVYAAVLQRRVLLLDLDFRHPSMLQELNQKCWAAEEGVIDLLLHNRSPGEVIRHVPKLGLDYLPVTHCPSDPLALFATDRLSELLCRLRDGYDCVVIDGPPLLGVTEARMLAALADKVLIVVKWGGTRREVARSAVHLLRSAGCFDTQCIDVPAAVVTQVNLKQHAKYRYGDAAELLARYKRDRSRPVART